MSGLLYEIRGEGIATWTAVAALTPSDPPGSISQNTPERRDVIMFRCAGDHSVVERSVAGADTEVGRDRLVVTMDTEVLATLTAGQSYEADVISDRGMAYKARWTHV